MSSSASYAARDNLFGRASGHEIIEWGAAILAHNLLLRGGELCSVEGKPLDVGRDLVFGAIEWREPCSESRGLPWVTVDVVAVKDTEANHRICPMPVR